MQENNQGNKRDKKMFAKFVALVIIGIITTIGCIFMLKEKSNVDGNLKVNPPDFDEQIEVGEIDNIKKKYEEELGQKKDSGEILVEEDMHEHDFMDDMESVYLEKLGQEDYEKVLSTLTDFATAYFSDESNVEGWKKFMTKEGFENIDLDFTPPIKRKVYQVELFPIVGESDFTFEVKVEYGDLNSEKATETRYMEVTIDKNELKVSDHTLL